MHPVLESKERLLLYLAAWLPMGGLVTVILVVSGQFTWGEAALLAPPLMLLYSFLCLAAWYPCRAFPLKESGWAGMLGAHGAGALLSSALWVLMGAAWCTLLSWFGSSPNPQRYRAEVPLLFVIGAVLYVAAVLAHYLLDQFEQSRSAKQKALQLELQAREAELRALRAQLDPHFLFNSLHSISALTASDPARARLMCERLGGFLRRSLDLGRRDSVPLREELSLISDFLEVEKVRFGARLQFRLEAEPAAMDCAVPPLILQPLVENAIRHGISQMIEGGEIAVIADVRGETLHLAVENPCESESAIHTGAGVGLANVRKRLQTFYGREGRVESEFLPDRHIARLAVPRAAPAHADNNQVEG